MSVAKEVYSSECTIKFSSKSRTSPMIDTLTITTPQDQEFQPV